jgi:hypothetical protein
MLGIPNLMLAEDLGWPREVVQNGARIVYYQPQIDKWTDYHTLDARMAITVTPSGGKTTPGVISISARTDANKEDRTVFVSDKELRLRPDQRTEILLPRFRTMVPFRIARWHMDLRKRGPAR